MEKKPIGIFDSGVGGLTVMAEVIKILPGEDIIYFGDTKHNPYGPRPMSEIRSFVATIGAYLVEARGCKALIVACNTAATAGEEVLAKRYKVPVLGPVKAGIDEALIKTRNGRIGVLATEATINSSIYQRLILASESSINVYSTAAPELVTFVEQGEFNGPRVENYVRHYLIGLVKAGIDTIILGCTHYPYLEQVIQAVVGNDIALVYPGAAIALELKEGLDKNNLKDDVIGVISCLVSDRTRLSNGFLKDGLAFLNMEKLEFSEANIFNG